MGLAGQHEDIGSYLNVLKLVTFVTFYKQMEAFLFALQATAS